MTLQAHILGGKALSSCSASAHFQGQTVEVHYLDTAPDRADAEVVVMLHGSGPGSDGFSNFIANFEAFARAGFRVLLPDLPGFGQSDSIVCAGSRPSLNAAALRGVLSAARVTRPVHVMGASMGAFSAVAFALEYPDQVSKLIPIAGGAISLTPSAVPEGLAYITQAYQQPSARTLGVLLRAVFHDSSAITDEFVQSRLDILLQRPDHLRNFLQSWVVHPEQYPDLSSRFSEIKAPTLLVWGRNDCFVPLDSSRELLNGIAQAELHVFNQCGHSPQVEHAARFNRLALDFLLA